jgi:hypothetical protein
MSEDKYKNNIENDFNSFISPNNSIDEDNSFEINFNEFLFKKTGSELFVGENDPKLITSHQNDENIDGDQNISFINENIFKNIQNEIENKNEDKKVEIIISLKEEDKEKNSTKKEEKKNEKKKVNFKSLKMIGKKRKIKYKDNLYEYFYDKEQYKHSKSCLDNIKKKLINHFFPFLIKFLNAILRKKNYKKEFFNLNKKDKIFSSISKKNINKLKNKTIEEILSLEISTRYNYYKTEKKANQKIYKDFLEKFPQMETLFKKTFFDIFNEIYCNKNKKVKEGIIDLNIYKINLIIDLKKEKLETYEEHLIKKNKNKDKKESDDYINKIKKFIETKNL